MDWTEHLFLRAALEWQIDLGAVDAIGEVPVDRYAVGPKAKKPEQSRPVDVSHPAPQPRDELDPVGDATKAAHQAKDLDALRAALGAFDHCELKRGARNLVFSDGVASAPIMIIGEAPGRDEDREGRPFVGRAGQLLDRMLAAIRMGRSDNVYITNVLPWRPPQNRDPRPDEIAMMRPFMQRHVDLIAPQAVVLMGNISCDAGLRKRGIIRLRGTWTEAYGVPALPMFHPAYLLRTPSAKRAAWADLLSLKAFLDART